MFFWLVGDQQKSHVSFEPRVMLHTCCQMYTLNKWGGSILPRLQLLTVATIS